jgi:hypothetical protein
MVELQRRLLYRNGHELSTCLCVHVGTAGQSRLRQSRCLHVINCLVT